MIVINIIGYIAIAYIIFVFVIVPFITKSKKYNSLYRIIEPFKNKGEWYIIPTIQVNNNGPFLEINVFCLCYGIYISYRRLTNDEDIAMDTALWEMKEKDDKSK